jgi:hypothetical protein
LQIKTEIVSFYTADSKPVELEGNGTVIFPPLVFPGWECHDLSSSGSFMAEHLPHNLEVLGFKSCRHSWLRERKWGQENVKCIMAHNGLNCKHIQTHQFSTTIFVLFQLCEMSFDRMSFNGMSFDGVI